MQKTIKQVTKEVKAYFCDICDKQAVRRRFFSGVMQWDKDGKELTRVSYSNCIPFRGFLGPNFYREEQELVICPDCFQGQIAQFVPARREYLKTGKISCIKQPKDYVPNA
jgi:ribosomal protein L37AE/L43A